MEAYDDLRIFSTKLSTSVLEGGIWSTDRPLTTLTKVTWTYVQLAQTGIQRLDSKHYLPSASALQLAWHLHDCLQHDDSKLIHI